MKRPRRRKKRDHQVKPGITVHWCPVEEDFVIDSPNRPDGHLVVNTLSNGRPRQDLGTGELVWDLSFIDELRNRGYDTTTLKVTCERLYPANGTPVPGK